jgi:hypothetical protein
MVSRHLDTNCVGRIGIVQYKASIGMNRVNCMANLTQEKLEWLLYCKLETSCYILVQMKLGFCRVIWYACIGFYFWFSYYNSVFNIAHKSFNEPIIMLIYQCGEVRKKFLLFLLIAWKENTLSDTGTPELGGGGKRGSRPRCPLPGGAKDAKVPFNLKDCLGEIANCQKC